MRQTFAEAKNILFVYPYLSQTMLTHQASMET